MKRLFSIGVLGLALHTINPLMAGTVTETGVVPVPQSGAVFRAAASAPADPCAYCADSFSGGSQVGWKASWENYASGCNPEVSSNCAECEPACVASASIGPTDYESAWNWYQAQSCAAWACGGGGVIIGQLNDALVAPAADQLSSVARVVAASNGRLRYNQERRVIQFFDCRVAFCCDFVNDVLQECGCVFLASGGTCIPSGGG